MSKTRDTGFLNNVVKTDSQGNVFFVSGSTTLLSISSSGAVTTTGVISGSNALSSSYALNADQVDGLNSTSFVFTSSYNTDSSSVSTRVTRIEGNYATTGSNVFLGAQTVCANITSTGTIIAQTLNVQQVTSSVVYSSGSNVFGCSLSNTQQFTGSVTMTGSLNVTGNASFANCITACNAFIQVPSTAAVVDILRLNNPAVASSGTRLKFENGYGDLAALRVIHMDNGSLADDGQIEFQTAQNAVLGTRMTILNTGQIGMGTLSPSADLQVNKNCDVVVAISNCISVITGNRGALAFYNCATSTVAMIRAAAVTDNVGTELQFYTRPAAGSLTQNVTISSVGQLLVNTTNWPSSVIANSANRHMIGGATEPNLILWNEATAAANNQSSIWLGAKSATGATYIGGVVIQGGLENATNSCGYLAFRTTDTTAGTNERMRITAAGNVGIGTNSPCARLHIQGAANAEDLLYFCTGGSVNTKFVFNINSGADDAFVLRRNHTTQGNLCIMSWTYNGYVGIGTTTPSEKLEVVGPDASAATIRWRNGGGRKSGYLYSDSVGVGIYDTNINNAGIYLAENQQIDFRVGGAQRMRIECSGLSLFCGRMSSIMASSGNIQEWVGLTGVIPNNTGWSLFSIANQYDNLSMDIYVFTDVGSFQASKHEVIFGYTSSTYIANGFAAAFCVFRTGTQYNETMTICNLSGSQINSQRIAIRVWGYGVGQNGTGGSNLLTTSCLTRIK